MNPGPSWFSEIRRRNVVRSGLAWLALSWLLVAVADLLLPRLGLPQGWTRGLILGLLLALPLVLFLAWRYEMTPQGLRLDRGPRGDNPENVRTGRRIDQLTIVLVLAALALSGVRQLVLPEMQKPDDAAKASTDAPAQTSSPIASTPVPPVVAELRPPAPAGPVEPRSLAVLAFNNLSPDPDNAFLAEGIAEEILNVLARIEGLQVASRTSSFSFRDQSLGAREIGRQLGVAHVLDGSLRRQDNRIRITVELVQAAEDRHLWSDTFDRELTDIFSVQQEIAQLVADALADELGVRSVRVRRATEDLAAYELYLRGRQLFALRGANLEPARSLLQQAVERDPRFAEAWATLAGVQYVLPSYQSEASEALSAQADHSAREALELIPNQPDALAVRGRLLADAGERIQAHELFERALAADPNNANTWMWKGLTLLEAGHVRAAREAFAQGQRLDPLSGIHFGWLGATELIHGEFALAREHLERAHALGWRGPASAWLLKLALAEGDRAAASERFEQWLRDDGRITADARAVHESVAAAISDPQHLDAARQTLLDAVHRQPDYDWTVLHQFLGLTDEAIEEALRDKPASGQILLMMIWSPVDQGFREHPRFAELAARAGLPDYWKAQGGPDVCRWLAAPQPQLECER